MSVPAGSRTCVRIPRALVIYYAYVTRCARVNFPWREGSLAASDSLKGIQAEGLDEGAFLCYRKILIEDVGFSSGSPRY